MKQFKISFVFCSIFLGVATQSHAILIDQGDTTLQTSADLEWLDITATAGLSINQVLGNYGGYISNGWQLATMSQVESLYLEAGASDLTSIGFTSNADNVAAAESLLGLLGQTNTNTFYQYGTLNFFSGNGWALSDDGTFATQRFYQVAEDESLVRLTGINYPTYQLAPEDWNGINGNIGHYLVRVQVPEPGTLSLMLIPAILFSALRKKKTNQRS